jgi:hypothetical protein
MKLSDAAQLCEANSRAFIDVYKHYNFKDEDTLKDYCDFVIHEPVEWMRGFPAAWKSVGLFSKPRAAFHRLLKQTVVIEELTEAYCENVHSVVWNSFKTHMNAILEKRNGAAATVVAANVVEEAEDDNQSVISSAESDALTAESFHSDEIIHPVPPVPTASNKKRPQQLQSQQQQQPPRNTIAYTVQPLNYKQKYEVLNGVLNTLLGSSTSNTGEQDENCRLRAALAQLLAEFSRM